MEKILKAFLRYGCHRDEWANFDSFLPEVISMAYVHFRVTEVKGESEQHQVYLVPGSCHFNLPWDETSGFDSPDQSALSGNYTAMMRADVMYEISDVASGQLLFQKKKENHLMMEMPALVGSKLCNLRHNLADPRKRHYLPMFFVNRLFKVIPYDLTYINNLILHRKEDEVEVRSSFHDPVKKHRTNSTIKFHLKRTNYRRGHFEGNCWAKSSELQVQLPHEKSTKSIPMVVLALAFGCSPTSFGRQVEELLPESQTNIELRHNLDTELKTEKEALLYISGEITNCKGNPLTYVRHLLDSEFLPNLNVPDPEQTNARKVHLLAEAAAELLGNRPVEHENSYKLKCLETPMASLIKLIRRFMKYTVQTGINQHWKKFVEGKCDLDINKLFNASNIKLVDAIVSGSWKTPLQPKTEFNQNRTHTVITGCSYASLANQVQKIQDTVNMKRMPSPLQHPSIKGRVDPFTTPENEKCGNLFFKAMGCHISPHQDLHLIQTIILEQLQGAPEGPYRILDVFGGLIGRSDPTWIYRKFTSLRRSGVLPFLGVEVDDVRRRIVFHAQSGRMLRPMLVNAQLHLLDSHWDGSWTNLYYWGIVESLDPNEEYSGRVTSDTHTELPSVLNFTPNLVKPYFNMNPGPRITYTSLLNKNRIPYCPEPMIGSNGSFSLESEQYPLQTNLVDELLGEKEANGVMVRLAIINHPANMEDACVVNLASVHMGMGNTKETKIYGERLTPTSVFARPGSDCKGRGKKDAYDYLQDDGLPLEGTYIPGGYAVVGRVEVKCHRYRRCSSVFLPDNQLVYRVDSVRTHSEGLVVSFVEVTVSRTHSISVGDKLFFAHGQKGTVGELTDRADLPYNVCGDFGSTPDVMINICGLMRTTPGLLMEMLSSTAYSLKPSRISQYATLFLKEEQVDKKITIIEEVFREHGMHYTGKSKVICGKTGEMLNASVFSGMVYMRFLNHLAQSKLRGRGLRGPLVEITRQPTAGKKSTGGQKVGEMENHALFAHGGSAVFSNCNYDADGPFVWNGKQVPYVTALTVDELATMGVGIELE